MPNSKPKVRTENFCNNLYPFSLINFTHKFGKNYRIDDMSNRKLKVSCLNWLENCSISWNSFIMIIPSLNQKKKNITCKIVIYEKKYYRINIMSNSKPKVETEKFCNYLYLFSLINFPHKFGKNYRIDDMSNRKLKVSCLNRLENCCESWNNDYTLSQSEKEKLYLQNSNLWKKVL